jgi:hypothetical protein
MQVLCKGTQENADVHCEICGMGFVLFWERQSPSERAQGLAEIQETLRQHHRASNWPEAHPERSFLVPRWDGPIAFSGAAILGNAPAWAL